MDWLYAILSAAFGLVVGSFLNVVIYRLPVKGKFFEKSRSYCPKCGAELKWYHNIPVFSYVFLRGRCAFCKEKISPRYPLVELLNAGLWVANYFVFGLSWNLLIWDVAVSALVAMAFVDIDTKEILYTFMIVIALCGAASFFVPQEVPVVWWERLLGMAVVSVPMLILALITGGMGGGDVKLYAAIGLLLGWKLTLVSALIAIVLGGIGAVLLIALKKAKKGSEMPFGPYIALGVILAGYFGNDLLAWYLSAMGL
ncbi:MAG TPA: prepilin peptidase [Clostridiales bacterium]|nr:prepilin peptidase [Clostridiales bacterium]